MTAPHVGNTGVNDEDDESRRIWVAGYVVRDPARRPSSWRSQRSPGRRPGAQGVVGICGVDTRALTRHLRERGAMRVGCSPARRPTSRRPCWSASGRAADDRRRPRRRGHHPEPYVVPAVASKRFTVAALDLGIKAMTPRLLAQRGIEVHVLPATTTFERDASRLGADGVFFSNGPGDPASAEHEVARAPAGARARGSRSSASASATSCSAGRSASAPTSSATATAASTSRCWTARTGKVEVTAHNHGFAVDAPLDAASSDDRPLRAGRGHPRLPQRRRRGGPRVPRPAGVLRAVPPGGGGRPARRRLPLRPLRR